jgi:hypothetical protein
MDHSPRRKHRRFRGGRLSRKRFAKLSRRFKTTLSTIVESMPLAMSCEEADIKMAAAASACEESFVCWMFRCLRLYFIQLKSLPRRTHMMIGLGVFGLCSLYALDRATTVTMSDSKWARMMYEETDPDGRLRGGASGVVSQVVERPRDLHIAFVGDSVTRYMYLDFVYFLKNNRWVQDEDYPNILNAKHFPSWNDHYEASNIALRPNEQCDCFRNNPKNSSAINKEETIENRYFSDPERNNYATFIEVFGGYKAHGHWHPEDVYKQHKLNFGEQDPFVWRYDWPGLIRNYLAKLEPKPEYLVFNEGLWIEHELGDPEVRQSIKDALDDTGIIGIYKTTTLPNINSGLAKRSAGVVFNRHDQAMCDLIGLYLDFTWTKDLGDEHYWDGVHFKPHVNRGMNVELMDFLKNLKQRNQRQKVTTGDTTTFKQQ